MSKEGFGERKLVLYPNRNGKYLTFLCCAGADGEENEPFTTLLPHSHLCYSCHVRAVGPSSMQTSALPQKDSPQTSDLLTQGEVMPPISNSQLWSVLGRVTKRHIVVYSSWLDVAA